MIIWERITNISIKFETMAVSNTKRVLSKTNANSRSYSSNIFRMSIITTGFNPVHNATISARKYSNMMRKQ